MSEPSASPSSHAEPGSEGGQPPQPLSPESLARLEEIYPVFLETVEGITRSLRRRLTPEALRHQALTYVVDDIPEDQQPQAARHLVERYNAEKPEQEEVPKVPTFKRGNLATRAEKEPEDFAQHLKSKPLSRYERESLRRAHTLSKFGVVSHFFFKKLWPSARSRTPELRSSNLEIPEDPTSYLSPDEIEPPSIGFDALPSSIDAKKWLQAAQIVHDFIPRSFCRPEQQFIDQLWAPLLVECFRIVDEHGFLSWTSQLSMGDIAPDLEADRYIDLACLLNSIPGRDDLADAFKIPILMVEVAAFEVKNEYDHKDFVKQLVAMAIALVALLGIFRDRPVEVKKELRMFGMFISGHQCLPCVMVPVDIGTETASFVVYCDKDNRFNLLGNDWSSIPDTDSVKGRDVQQELKKAGVRFDTSLNDDANTIASRLKPLVAFCSTIRRYGEYLRGLFQEMKRPDERFSIWPGARIIPQSRPSHEQSTPASKRARKSSQRASRSRGRNVTIQEVCHDDGSITIIKEKSHSSRKEADLLSAAQGDGIVVLKGFHLPSDSSSRGCILFEELLDYVDFAGLSSAELGLLAIRLFIDGLAALKTLESAGIVHRDISPNNLMYSFEAQAWRLTDFDAAEYQSCATSTPNRFGTDGFIAPEAISSGQYTYASDRWSLGRTLEHIISCIRDEVWSRTEEQDVNIEGLLIRLETDYCLFLLSDDPASRQITSSDLEYLSDEHTGFEKYIALHVRLGNKTVRPRAPITNPRPVAVSKLTCGPITPIAGGDPETVPNIVS